MSAELLLREFERVSDASDAVSRLRRFVLAMAVRGRLVGQASHEGDALTLIREATVPTLDRTKRVTLSSEFPEASEIPFAIPDAWMWCRLNQVGVIIGGGTPPSADADNFAPGGTAIAWLTPADMARQADLVVRHGERDLTKKGLASSSATLMPEGTVLFTSRAPIGYVGVAGQEITTNQGFKSLVPSSAVASRYAAIFFRAFAPVIDAAAPGTTFKEVSGKIVSSLVVPLPPLAEQHRIVAKVDELMDLCDQLELAQKEREQHRDALRAVSLHRLTATPGKGDTTKDVKFFLKTSERLITKPEHVGAVRQTVLDLAVSGGLVRQNPDDQPAAELLRQIEFEQAQSLPLKGMRRPTLAMQVSTDELPNGWVSTTVSQVFRVTGGIQKQPKRSPADNAFPYLGVSNVQRARLDLHRVSRFELFPGELERYRLEPGDLLVVEGNGSPAEIGRCARWNGEIVECVHQNHIIRCRPLRNGIERFVLLYLNAPSGTATMRNLAITSAGLYSLSVGKIQKIIIPLPPLAEQRRIVEKVDELMAVCDELEGAFNAAEDGRARFSSSLLQEVLSESVVAEAAVESVVRAL